MDKHIETPPGSIVLPYYDRDFFKGVTRYDIVAFIKKIGYWYRIIGAYDKKKDDLIESFLRTYYGEKTDAEKELIITTQLHKISLELGGGISFGFTDPQKKIVSFEKPKKISFSRLDAQTQALARLKNQDSSSDKDEIEVDEYNLMVNLKNIDGIQDGNYHLCTFYTFIHPEHRWMSILNIVDILWDSRTVFDLEDLFLSESVSVSASIRTYDWVPILERHFHTKNRSIIGVIMQIISVFQRVHCLNYVRLRDHWHMRNDLGKNSADIKRLAKKIWPYAINDRMDEIPDEIRLSPLFQQFVQWKQNNNDLKWAQLVLLLEKYGYYGQFGFETIAFPKNNLQTSHIIPTRAQMISTSRLMHYT